MLQYVMLILNINHDYTFFYNVDFLTQSDDKPDSSYTTF